MPRSARRSYTESGGLRVAKLPRPRERSNSTDLSGSEPKAPALPEILIRARLDVAGSGLCGMKAASNPSIRNSFLPKRGGQD